MSSSPKSNPPPPPPPPPKAPPRTSSPPPKQTNKPQKPKKNPDAKSVPIQIALDTTLKTNGKYQQAEIDSPKNSNPFDSQPSNPFDPETTSSTNPFDRDSNSNPSSSSIKPSSTNPFDQESISKPPTQLQPSTSSNPFDRDSSPSNPFVQDSTNNSNSPHVSLRNIYDNNADIESSTNELTHLPPPKPAKPSASTSEKSNTTNTSDKTLIPKIKHINMTPAMGVGEPGNTIYYKTAYNQFWMLVFLIIHIVQFIFLFYSGFNMLPTGVFVVLLILSIIIVILVVYSRFRTRKSNLSSYKNIKLRNGVCTPEHEADDVSDRSVYALAFAAVLEGICFAIFSSILAGDSSSFKTTGYTSQYTVLQTLRFASITLLALHRILRPANRIDPLRTILEVEVVAICWDAIDGSTLFELLDTPNISGMTADAIHFLMAFWYFSVGLRMALMFLTHLSPNSRGYNVVLTHPYQLAPQPTVDRTLQGLRLRSMIIMMMATADFFAAGVRIALWSQGKLDSLQQDMAIKNFLFLISVSGAYDMYENTICRNWNTRVLFTFPWLIQYPTREKQLGWLFCSFIASYLVVSIVLTVMLIDVSPYPMNWIGNLVIDILLILIFIIYYRHIHVKDDHHEPGSCLFPKKRYFKFPGISGIALGAVMIVSLLAFRIPSLYSYYNNFDDTSSSYTYTNATLVVALSIVPIALYSNYWSIAYMVFRKEFTATPGNYNAIHDPVIQMISIATMTEGALDILSCATLMELASNNLPPVTNGFVVLFCLLEIFNGCQSFAFQCFLSGGSDDTPLDLVRWNARLRFIRVVIDAGAIILRLVLWIQFNAVSSVFLVKNLYNLIHTYTQIERSRSVKHYPKDTLFSQFVAPQDWYGMTKEQWRHATSETLLAQARSGRGV